ncbi:MAG: metallophosphoesterase [Myxococcota bacterium]|nr:metallophosphoesterase [Myxococcota bacterium]
MHLLFHLSDLHIDAESETQRVLFEVLIETLRREKEASKAVAFALVITGDVFDSGTMPVRQAVPLFMDLHARIVAAVACPLPSIVLPGNHDRRWRGLVGPHRLGLFNALREAVDPKSVYVAGCQFPFLAEVVPQSFHGLPADIVAYDSTYLPSGWLSAGGMIRQEDLLQVHAQLKNGSGDRPLVVLVHHHLIPTPVTDVSFINSGTSISRLPRWLLGSALPTIVANADREELTMTALGAGTALSTLHSFGRAVLLLHGHKHFPTARLVRGLTEDAGDVLIASAGSGGRRERLDATHDPEAASLWPSFNVVRMDRDRVEIEVVSFPSRHLSRAPARRDLAHVSRRDVRWEPHPASAHIRDCAVPVALDEARFVLSPSRTEPDERWDYVCERRVQLFPGARLRRYVDFAHGAGVARGEARAPRRRVALALDGITRYRVANGLCRTAEVARRTYGTATAFEWTGLLTRYGGATATLSLGRPDLGDFAPFGSITDLATGRETPAPVDATDEGWRLTIKDCAPRTFLRIYWPLAAGTP